MRPTEALSDEHRIVQQVLGSLETALRRTAGKRALKAEFLMMVADFSSGFTDACHHRKEEGILFPALLASGLPSDHGPVAAMLADHEEGRRLTREIRASAEGTTVGDLADQARASGLCRQYVDLLRQHILKEDSVLFPMADRMIPPGRQHEMAEEFERIELEEVGEGVHEKFLGLAREIEKAASRS